MVFLLPLPIPVFLRSTTHQWASLPNSFKLPHGLGSFAACVSGAKLFLFTGHTEDGLSSACFSLDLCGLSSSSSSSSSCLIFPLLGCCLSVPLCSLIRASWSQVAARLMKRSALWKRSRPRRISGLPFRP